ncbi:probable beta-D-xylosidase 2 isoform X2 [Pomacea canaliculata]|nr:probable beta-D-xylosidase 2 isoform X2 [Pomacea canaliculata]
MSLTGGVFPVFIFTFVHMTTGDYPFRNVSLPWDTRVDNLVSLLTLEELQSQMAFGGHGPAVSPAPPIPRLGVGPYSWNTECMRGDIDAGPATSFPQALGLAASFSPDLVERVARATGLEVRAKYNNYTKHGLYGDHRGLSCFSPVINIMRDPRWGRNQETYGEDPILSGILATSYVHGLQGNDTRYILTNAGCKHFDVHGGPENIPVSRFSFDAQNHFKMTLTCGVFPVFIFTFVHLTTGDYPFRNVSLPWDTRVDNLVSLLTLEELQSQMAFGGHGPAVSPAPPIPRLGVGPYSWNTECMRGDINAGPATSFPQALGLAASFSPDLLERVARATGLEVRAKYNNYTKHGLYGDHRGLSCFSPVINIMRDPRWGRNQETYGEDPILSGILATSYVHGLQGNDTRYILTNAGCKHFDVHGGPENIPVSRFAFNAQVSDRDWQTTFLPAFKACVNAGTYSLMCSYNSINGVPACANKKLLTDILRDDWGFTGYVVSDEGALEHMITDHHYVADNITAAAEAIDAGCNLEVSRNNVQGVFTYIVQGVESGQIPEDKVRERAKPLFYTRMRLGEFDPPSMNPYTDLDLSIIQSPDHQALALEAAMKSFVLLKNRNSFLPLKKSVFNRVSIVGPLSNNITSLYGDHYPTINETLTVSPLQGLSPLGDLVVSIDGCSDARCVHYDPSKIKTVVDGADIVFVCLGTDNQIESEGHDRTDIELPGQQLQLLQDAVAFSNGAPVVLLLFNAGPLNITWADESPAVVAILECFYPAQATGTALYRVLTNYDGVSSPAARLPATWPLLASQIPDMVNYSMAGRTYRYLEGQTLYPFGYGLSYTTFTYSDLKTPPTVNPGQDLLLQVTVNNTGLYSADEVTQVYITWVNYPVPTLNLQLVAVSRTALTSGQAVTLNLMVPSQFLAVYTDSGWETLPGTIRIYVGGQQPGQQRSVGSNVLSADVIIA